MNYLEKIEYYKKLKNENKKPRNIKDLDKHIQGIELKIKCLVDSIDKDVFEDYYKKHSKEDTMNYFNINQRDFKFLLEYFNIIKSQKDIKKLTKSTCLKKYGVDNPQKSSIIKAKTKQTNLERYGVDCILKSADIKSRIANTNLEKYGAKNVFSSSIIKDKIKSTILERYGVEYVSQSNEMIQHSKQTKLDRYNDSGYNNREKARETCLIRYGSTTPAGNISVQNKMKDTTFIKYGVSNAAQSREIAQKIAHNRHNVRAIDGTPLDSQWEKYVYDYCLRNNIPIERNIPLDFIYEGENHRTFIDFKIDGILFEIKNSALLNGCFDYNKKITIDKKLELYKQNHVILITDYADLFTKHQTNGLKYLDKCSNPLIGVDIDLFKVPQFPFNKNKPECYYKVRVNNKISSYDAFFDEKIRWKMIKNRIMYVGGYIDSKQILNALNVTRYCKQPSWFSKNFAKYIIQKYVTSNTVLDTFAGWGTRYDACKELNKNYIGCDLNKELVNWHNSVGRNIECADAKDFKYLGDCSVFICPPYTNIEIYFDNQDTSLTQCEWLSIVMKNIPNANEYVMVCKVVDKGFEKYIVETKENKSHFGLNKEYILVIKNEHNDLKI